MLVTLDHHMSTHLKSSAQFRVKHTLNTCKKLCLVRNSISAAIACTVKLQIPQTKPSNANT